MSKYNIHIGSLSPEENKRINDATNSNQEVQVEVVQEEASSAEGKSTTVIHQTVHQYGEHNYTFDKPVSGMRIGDDIRE